MSTRSLCLVLLLTLVGCAAAESSSKQRKPQAKSMNSEHAHTNRLIDERSPYLLQHAHNPVDWYPWGEEAFQRARAEDKPIFVSIGYSTCHWCHVMERESFENEEIAALMNEHFICIKVDREERPDVDEIYMNACQMMTGQGGWPLSAFLLPDLRPFFAGTYFPPEDRYGRSGFKSLLQGIAEAWGSKREQIESDAGRVSAALGQLGQIKQADGEIGGGAIERAMAQMSQSFDARLGGWGSAPKFPRSSYGALCLRRYARAGDGRALEMARTTLDRMAAGGIYDHLGGGFHRYSTDAQWLAPHFEKMLYDNAQLVLHYTEAYQLLADPEYERVVRETVGYILRDMTDAHGGFYSAEDADSEGEEGKFYVWSDEEIREALGGDAALFSLAYDVSPQGNWEGHTILRRVRPAIELADTLGIDERAVRESLSRSKSTLLAQRETRIRPGLDDKVLTAWNGLMIEALARAGVVFGEDAWVETAERAARFVLEEMHDGTTLLRRWRDGQARYPAYAEDYAMFVAGLLELYQADFDLDLLERARALHAEMFERFGDAQDGVLFNSVEGADDLIVRVKVGYDGAVPTANSVAASNAVRLFELTGEPGYWTQAERLLRAFAATLAENPMGLVQMLLAVDAFLGERVELVLAGESSDPAVRAFLRDARSGYLPVLTVAHAPSTEDRLRAEALLPALVGKGDVEAPTAYVCRGFICRRPTQGRAEMLEDLALYHVAGRAAPE
jgi:uncharacterized protein YyaL (SSP411 family)